MTDSGEESEFMRFLVRASIKESNREKLSESSSKRIEPDKVPKTNVDNKFLYNLSNELVRIEYPGLVKNASKAIKTLGGMSGIEMAASNSRIKLELHFHPENKYNKPSFADRDLNPGLLVRVKESQGKVDYDIVGYTGVNFKFNKMCEFQYLPLVPTKNFSEEEVEYIYDKIIPHKIPDLEYFCAKDNAEQPLYSLPSGFSRYDYQNTLYLKAGEKFCLDTNTRPELFRMFDHRKPRNRLPTTCITKVIRVLDSNVEIPTEPYPGTMELIKARKYEDAYEDVKKLFEEKPMLTKIEIRHKTGITMDMSKIILPAVAYFCSARPWRMVWARFGYNPLKDVNSRVYQILDFRIRSKAGTTIKVNAKRPYTKQLGVLASLPKKVSSSGCSSEDKNQDFLEERSYILSPEYIPPARQMFYQFCNIKIPEIQEMFQRLPKLSSHQKLDPKTGWLPMNFIEQCREIANKYVIDRVHQELIEDSIRLQRQQEDTELQEDEETRESTSAHCSRMLGNMKMGMYSSFNKFPVGGEISFQSQDSPMIVDTVELEDSLIGEEVDMNDVVNSIPETMPENSDDENLSQCSDGEIDLETADEINKLIEATKKNLEFPHK
ncbi:general transcription factor IIIC subunit l(2)37Cd [Leptinotarsa decemlineata]|uniref:general transcription factor IIIC subunit l(2)37Cd n=1 Tax=Leptinotarsa decemlineata TaxID=7539 RepID=UPI003D309211